MIGEYFSMAIRNLLRRRLRSWLTILGILIGITAIVSLISVSQGMKATITKQFEKLGYDKVIIFPGKGMEDMMAGLTSLSEHDLKLVRTVPGVDLATGLIYKIGKVEYNNDMEYTWVVGIDPESGKKIVEDIQAYEIDKGRDLRKGDKYKTILGYYFGTKDIFDRVIKPKDKIKIEGKEFEVIGLLKKIGNREDDSTIYIPFDIAKELFEEGDKLGAIYVKVKNGFETEKVAEKIKETLRRDRKQEIGEEDFSVQTTREILESFSSILAIIQGVIVGIAAISLLVGGIGIMNTMYTSVLERIREIGVMKAIGAKNLDISLMFLIESGLLGLVGGGFGVVTGVALAKIVEQAVAKSGVLGTEMLKAHFSPYLIISVLAFSFFVGMISGLFPAIKAAKQNPVDALRYE